MFGLDDCSVSWHADSSLEHFSSIAVYHTVLESSDSSRGGSSWRVAMRLRYDSEGPNSAGKFFSKSTPSQGAADENSHPEMTETPAIAVALPNKSCYYMLDDFNHHHQHAVLAGDQHRFASTHRVSRVDGHSFQSIKNRCENILQVICMYL
jgi:alpha-ketoglutarate-dependent dioxygenase FTO